MSTGRDREPRDQRADIRGRGRSKIYVAFRDIIQPVTNINIDIRRSHSLAQSADDLARTVRLQWERETERRTINESEISVRWDPVERGLTADWLDVVRLASEGSGWPDPPPEDSWADGPADLGGKSNELARIFRRIPTGRLVILGEPGAGKTILLVRLVLDLLKNRREGDPVPVLVQLASWNPEQHDLYAWLEWRLAIDYIGLNRRAPAEFRHRPGHAGWRTRKLGRALLDEGLILMVLDGLDEISETVRDLAISKINDALRPGQGLVLASRKLEFEHATRPPDDVETQLTGTPGVEVKPLMLNDAIAYLRESARGPKGRARWDGVLPELAADSTAPAAQALTTPLMVGLARVIYNPKPRESLSDVPHHPVELLNQVHFPTAASVREYLLEGFIPAAYRMESPKVARKAKRWLTFLARDLEHRQGGTNDLAWWQITGAAPAPLGGVAVGLAAGICGVLGLGSVPGSAGWGLIAAVAGGLAGRQFCRRDDGIARALSGGLLGGLVGMGLALAIGSRQALGPSLTGAIAACLAVGAMRSFRAGLAGGFAGGFLAALVGSPHVASSARFVNGLGLALATGMAAGITWHGRPARGFRLSRVGIATGLAAGLTFGLAAGLQANAARGLALGLVTAVGGGLAAGVEEAPSNEKDVTTPDTGLARDRRTFWMTAILGGLAVGLSTGLGPRYPHIQGEGLRTGLEVAAANTIAVGLAFGFVRAAYGKFALARWWLAGRGQLPWRLMRFLSRAHTGHGVLHQIGAAYEFRHIQLQRHLAGRP